MILTIEPLFHYEFTFCFVNSLLIHQFFCDNAINPLSFAKIYFELTIFLRINYESTINFVD